MKQHFEPYSSSNPSPLHQQLAQNIYKHAPPGGFIGVSHNFMPHFGQSIISKLLGYEEIHNTLTA